MNKDSSSGVVCSPPETTTAAPPPARPLAPEPLVVFPAPSHPEPCGPPPRWRPRLGTGPASSPPSSSGCARDGTPGTPDVQAAAGNTCGSHTINASSPSRLQRWSLYNSSDEDTVLGDLLLSLQQLLSAEVQLFGQHCKLLQGHKRELLETRCCCCCCCCCCCMRS
ncbi:hypothetical protein INR49_030523 [Caranx melampygus]|nr:hypothetical protein INR49_030523 [Caranx melampygus]